jgi:hypothetical protein
MPKLEIGNAIAKGAESFLKGYMQGKQLELQEKQLKNREQFQLLEYLMNDETAPAKVRADALDAFHKLIDPKAIVPLSQQTGLRDLLDEDVETEPENSYNSDSDQDGVDDTVNVQAARTKKRGDLSPSEFKSLNLRKQNALSQEDEFKRQERLAKLNFELQERSFRANGYNKVVAEGTDANGIYSLILANASGDTKQISMPEGFKPTKVTIAEQRANRPSTFIREREDYWEGQGKSPEEASRLALQDANKKFEGQLNYLGGQTTKQGQDIVRQKQLITGNTPLTTAERVSIRKEHEKEETRLLRQKQDVEREARRTSKLTTDLAKAVVTARARRDTTKKALDNYIRENGDDASDDSQKVLQLEYDRQEADYDRLQKQYDEVNAAKS